MANPNNFQPFFDRIIEVCMSQLGSGGRVVPSGSFTFDTAYTGKDDANIGRDVLYKPTFNIEASRLIDQNRVPENCSYAGYDVFITLRVCHNVRSNLITSEKTKVNAEILNTVHTIRRALSNPENLAQTAAGTDTGLSSGMLTFLYSSNPIYNSDAGVVSVDLEFQGQIWIDFV